MRWNDYLSVCLGQNPGKRQLDCWRQFGGTRLYRVESRLRRKYLCAYSVLAVIPRITRSGSVAVRMDNGDRLEFRTGALSTSRGCHGELDIDNRDAAANRLDLASTGGMQTYEWNAVVVPRVHPFSASNSCLQSQFSLEELH
jgi:hypothetical protein